MFSEKSKSQEEERRAEVGSSRERESLRGSPGGLGGDDEQMK